MDEFDPTRLLQFYGPGPERIGFILQDGEIVETKNVCHDPDNGFDFRGEDLHRYSDDAYGAFHTHPDVKSTLTEEDRKSFLDYPHLKHFIIGMDGVAVYEVKNGSVVHAASYPSARSAEEHSPGTDQGQQRDGGRGHQDGDGPAPRVPARSRKGNAAGQSSRPRNRRKSAGP